MRESLFGLRRGKLSLQAVALVLLQLLHGSGPTTTHAVNVVVVVDMLRASVEA